MTYLEEIRAARRSLDYRERELDMLQFRVKLAIEDRDEVHKELTDLVVEAWESGTVTQAQIGKSLDVSRQRVCKLLRAKGTTRYFPEKIANCWQDR